MKTVIFDLDGTLYRGTAPIEAGIRAVSFCQENNIPYMFLTNNSMRTPEQNIEHMEKMGYKNLKPEDFYNSAIAAAAWAAQQGYTRAAMIGQEGMAQAMKEAGFTEDWENPEVVFVGLDKEANYHMYSRALQLLLNGAKLVGTNKDRILASPSGFEVGNGSVVALFEYATGQKSPDISKPSPVILDLALKKRKITRKDAVLVGDNLETDISLGYNAGVQTIFVQSGVHQAGDIERLQIFPDQCVTSLDDVDWLSVATADGTVE